MKFKSVLVEGAHPITSISAAGGPERLKTNPFAIIGQVADDDLLTVSIVDSFDSELAFDDGDVVLNGPIEPHRRLPGLLG